MATKYWVGGNGNWSSTTNWRTASGGTTVTTAPGSADAAVLDANSGASVVTVDSNITIQTLTCTGFTGTLAFGTNTISLNSTGIIFTGATTMTVTGTPLIICTNSSATSRTITPTAVTEANSISFRITNGTGALGLTAGSYRDLDFTDGTNPTGYAGGLTNTAITIYGNFKASTSGMTRTAGASAYTFAATSGTKTINTAGVTFDCPFTFNGVGGTFQFASAVTSGATRTTTLTNGTLNLNGYTLTTGLFSTSSTNATALAFGTGNITLSGTGTIFAGSTTCTVTGTPQVICTDNSATARTISPGVVTEANSISFRIIAGTGTFTITSTNAVRDLDFTDGVNPTGFAGAITNTTVTVYGNLKCSTSGMVQNFTTSVMTFAATSGTKTINTAGVVFDRPFTFDGVGGTWQLQSNLILGPSPSGVASIRTCTLTNGTLNLNGYTLTTGLFSSTNSNTRTLAFGAGKLVVTGTNATVYTTSTGTGLTFTGTPVVEITGNGLSGETRAISAPQTALGGTISNSANIYIKAGADSISLGTAVRAIRTLDFTGFSGSIAASASPQIYGNLVLATGMTVTGGTNTWTFAATTSQTITTNSVTITNPITFDGVGGTWTMQDNLTLSSTRTLTLTNGTLDLNNKTLTTGIFVGSGSVARSLLTYSVPIIITGNSATVVSFGTTGSLTVDVPPTFNLTSNPVATTGSRVISWGTPSNTAAFPNINVTNGSDTVTTSGTSTLRNLTFTSGFTGTFGNLVRNIYGNLTLTSGMSVGSGTGVTTFNGVGSQTITTAGLTLDFPITFDGVGGTWTLQDNLNAGTVSGSGITLTNGTLNLNSKTITTFSFASANSNNRTLAFGLTGKIVLTGFNNVTFSGATSTNATVTGTAPLIQFTYSGGTGQRNITMWALPESQSISIEVLNNATDIFTIQGTSGGYRNIDTTNFNGTLNIANSPKVFGDFTIGVNVISPVTIIGSNPLTFAATSGTKKITGNYIQLNGDITFDGVGGTWQLQDWLYVSASTLNLINGTLDANYKYISVGSFNSTGSGNRSFINFANIYLYQDWNVSGTNFTLQPTNDNSTILLISNIAQQFNGNSLNYPSLLISGPTSVTITGSNLFVNFYGNSGCPIYFEAGSTQRIYNPIIGNGLIDSTINGTQFTLYNMTGKNVVTTYSTIKNSSAMPRGYWFAPVANNNVDAGNNTGWNFNATQLYNQFLDFLVS
jgi:hypothetical protein